MKTLLTILALCCASFAQTTVFPKTTVFKKTTIFGNMAVGGGGGGTVTIDQAVATTPGITTTQSVNITISAGCANAVLFVQMTEDDAGTPASLTALTYNGTSILANVVYSTSPEAGNLVSAYRLINPLRDGTAHSVSGTVNGAPAVGWHLSAASFCGVNQTTPVRVSGTAGIATGSPVSVTIACAANDAYLQNGTWAGGQAGTIQDTATLILSDTTTGTGSGYKTGLTGSSTPGWAIGSGGSVGSIGGLCVEHN